jgi:hypothetical protein
MKSAYQLKVRHLLTITTSNQGVALAIVNEDKQSVSSKDCTEMVCYKCHEKVHFATECTFTVFHFHRDGTDNYMSKQLPNTWVLLNNQLTVYAFHNKVRLANTCSRDTLMDIHCNAGTASTNLLNNFPRYGAVWYHPREVAYIYSLACLHDKGYCILYNTMLVMLVLLPHWKVASTPSTSPLVDCTAKMTKSIFLLRTAAENHAFYTNCDYSCAMLERQD